MNYLISAVTNVGISRKDNQDSVIMQLAQNKQHSFLLAAVCDGMGGLSGGEIASSTVVYALKKWFDTQCKRIDSKTSIQDIGEDCANMLKQLNERLKVYQVQQKKLMGTTLSCFLALDERYSIIHIGDSRIYKIDTQITQMTTDHTMVAEAVARGKMSPEQAAVSKERNKLSQCIGASRRYQPEISYGQIQQGTVFLICSDGFRHKLAEDEMYSLFQGHRLNSEQAMQQVCESAVQCVMNRKERDNISVALIKAE